MSGHKNDIRLIVLLVLCCVLASGCGSNVELSAGPFPQDCENLTAVVTADDIALLDRFTALKSADLSGSTCYTEIAQWAQAHPDVDVRYTVALPDGQTAESSVTSLDLTSCTGEELRGCGELLACFPNLSSVKLSYGKIGAEELVRFITAHPDIETNCRITVDGINIALDDRSLDLTEISAEGAAELIPLLPCMDKLEYIDLGDDTTSVLSWEDIAAIQKACPDAQVDFSFTLYGKKFTLDSTKMIISHKDVDDGGKLVRRVLRCMPKLTYLDMDSCGVGDEDMAAIRDEFPNVDVVWRIWFGRGYSVRTDVETILASNPDAAGELNSTNTGSLKYCTKVKHIDLGHNIELDDISFVSYMPDLEVAIFAMVRVTDFSPLADCPHLEFLELGASGLHDLTPLSNLKELRHLSVPSDPCLYDISPIYGLTELERLWIGPWTPISQDQIDKMQECAPNCYIDTYNKVNGSYDEKNGHPGWRFIGHDADGYTMLHPRYALLWEQFDYGNAPYCYAYAGNDPLYKVSSEP